MGALDTNTMIMVAAVVVLVLIALAIWSYTQKQQSSRLQQRFGPEYERTMGAMGSRAKAEAELKAREDRVGELNLVALAPADAVRFTQAWTDLQSRFVDNPKSVVAQADQLVRELMQKRGYPVADFSHRAADISVDHPAVVDNYRAAQLIAGRAERDEADTEDLRKAVVHYRVLFDELLEVKASAAS